MGKKRNILWTIPLNEIKESIEISDSYSNCLDNLGLYDYISSGYISILKKIIEENNFDISHFVNIFPKKIELSEIMVENSKHSRWTLKKKLIEGNIIEYKCQICGLENNWNDKELVLVLDHINGIPNDHRLENLRFLCPNCNSQTPTFSRNKKK